MLVHFFGDPTCPWTWITSCWLERVSAERDIEIRWRSLSLDLRDGEALPPGLPPSMHETVRAMRDFSRRALRVFEAARAAGDEDAVARLRLAVGRCLFVPDEPPGRPRTGLLPELLLHAGLSQLAYAAEDPRWDERIVASMREARDVVGAEAISPTLVFDGCPRRGLCGPVLASLPTRRAGLRIWDATVALLTESTFVELHRARTVPVLPPLT